MRTYRPKYTVDGVVHTSQRWWIDLHDHRGQRRRLAGLADRRATETIGRNIERLVRYKAAGEPPDPALAKWLADLPTKLQRALADIGLLERVKVAAGCPLVEYLGGPADLPCVPITAPGWPTRFNQSPRVPRSASTSSQSGHEPSQG